MKMENILQNQLGFLTLRIFQIDPQEKIRVSQQSRHQWDFQIPAVEPALCRECQRAYHAWGRPH